MVGKIGQKKRQDSGAPLGVMGERRNVPNFGRSYFSLSNFSLSLFLFVLYYIILLLLFLLFLYYTRTLFSCGQVCMDRAPSGKLCTIVSSSTILSSVPLWWIISQLNETS